jgi:hypothetical protein
VKALSLTQPWPWIILHLGKRIENRTRNIGNHRGPLFLHAAKSMTSEDWWSARNFVVERLGGRDAQLIPAIDSSELVRGVIFARCIVVTQRRPDEEWSSLWYEEYLHEQDRRWYMSHHHAYLLQELIATTKFVPCKGSLGFWNVPEAVLAELGGQS